jgi:hypothetical protein
MSSLLMRTVLAAVVTTASATYANAQQLQATLSGLNEVPPVSSPGQGTLTLNLNTQQQSLTYTLTYTNLRATVTQAHIHFGQEHVEGGIMVFLCSNVGAPLPETPACPGNGGTVSGMFTPTSVIGPGPQGISPGDFPALATALLSQTAYADVATTQFPGGEIRGQVIRRTQNQQK